MKRIALILLALVGCSGMSGGSGPAAGGAVGEAPSGGSLVAGGSAPLPISAPAAAASGGGVLSAPVDEDYMGGCDPKAFLLYGKDYGTLAEGDLETGIPWRQISDQPFRGEFSVIAMGGTKVPGLQVRAIRLSADKSKVSYRDFILNPTKPPHHPFTVEFPDPANGDRVELYYFPMKQRKSEVDGAIECAPFKTPDFSESWVNLDAAGFEELSKKMYAKIPLGVFTIQTFYRLRDPAVPLPGVDTLLNP
ncbi:MAG: hypothetical protein U1F66_09680 [bacterium]